MCPGVYPPRSGVKRLGWGGVGSVHLCEGLRGMGLGKDLCVCLFEFLGT